MGMFLKSIKALDVPRSTEEVSKSLGEFSGGGSISIEFTNGNKIPVLAKIKCTE